MVPAYISDLILPTVANVSRYELRNSGNISRIPIRTSTFRKSCIPFVINEWNNLQAPHRQCECESFNSFCYKLKTNSQHNIPKYFIDGKRKFSIIHARLRNFCSNLNKDLFDNYLRFDPTCSCQRRAETAEHYFFKCEHYIDQIIRIFRHTHEFHPLNVNIFLQGKETLSDNDNSSLFHHVQTYNHSQTE